MTFRKLTALLSILTGLIGWTLIAQAQTGLPDDVPARHPQAQAIRQAIQAGWFQGYDDGTFRPDADLTPEHAAKVLGRAFPDLTRGKMADLLFQYEPDDNLLIPARLPVVRIQNLPGNGSLA